MVRLILTPCCFFTMVQLGLEMFVDKLFAGTLQQLEYLVYKMVSRFLTTLILKQMITQHKSSSIHKKKTSTFILSSSMYSSDHKPRLRVFRKALLSQSKLSLAYQLVQSSYRIFQCVLLRTPVPRETSRGSVVTQVWETPHVITNA